MIKKMVNQYQYILSSTETRVKNLSLETKLLTDKKVESIKKKFAKRLKVGFNSVSVKINEVITPYIVIDKEEWYWSGVKDMFIRYNEEGKIVEKKEIANSRHTIG